MTVLFADVVGSTSLGGEHDPEFVRATLRETFAKLRELIAAYGGTVEKFIGDEVMAVFGAPLTHEDDAERAVRAAFSIRAAVAERNTRSTLPLELRIGIDSGEVVSGTEESDVLVTGRAVNAAARTREAAAPGEILVGASTREQTLASVRYGDARSVKAKGLGTVGVWPALGLVSSVPVRPAVRAAPLIGRQEELRLLLGLERRLHDHPRSSLVTVFGPAGIGKSRLAAEFADIVGLDRVRVGHCLPYGQAIAFWPLREIVHADLGIRSDDARDDALAKLRSAVQALFAQEPADADAVVRRLALLAGLATREETLSAEPPANLAQEMRWGLRRYLERRAAGRPLVIVIEDAHWADPALLDTLDHLAEWARAPLLLLCLARPELLDVRANWGAGRTNSVTLTLPPLTDAEAHGLVEGLLPPRALPANVREEIVRRSEGNPLFVEEFVRMLRELDEVGPQGGGQVDRAELVRIALPATLHGLIAARLDRLPSGAKDALKRAAVMGRVFSTEAIDAIDARPLSTDESLAEAARRDLIVAAEEPALGSGRTYRFRHALIGEVVYRGIPKAVRWRLHEGAGRWIEHTSGDRAAERADLVAYHSEQAYWAAREVEAPEARSLGVRAFDQLLAAATRWRHAGLLRAALALYDRASRLGEASGAPQAKLVEARGFAALTRCYVEGARGALARLDQALEEARSVGPSEVLVRLASQRAFMARVESLEASAKLFAEGIAAALETGDAELIAHATLMSNAQPWMTGDLDEHLRVLSRADALMSESGSVAERGLALAWLTTNALQRGDFTAALSYLQASERLAQASGSRFQLWAANRAGARDALAMGDREKALALAQSSLELAREVGARRLVGLSCARLGDVLYELGDLPRSRAVLEEGLAVLDPETMRETLAETQWKTSRTCLALGDVPSARTYAMAAAANVAPTDLYSQVTTRAALAAVEAADGRPSEAERGYREAKVLVATTGYRALAADVDRGFAAFLVAQRRGAEARPLLESARAFYASSDTPRLRAEIDELLARCDGVPR